jgi:hypothetical protein
MTMKLKPIALSLLLVGGCEEKQKETANAALPAPQQDAPVVFAPKQKEKIRLTISEMGIDNHGFLQLRVHNHTSVPLDLINISWFFYDKNGNQMMEGEYPRSMITTKVKDGSDSTVVGAGESKIFCNSLITAQRSLGSALYGVGDAEVKIYTRRSAFDALNLETDIECHETTIRQIFQSSRFLLQQEATTQPTLDMKKNEILEFAMRKAREGRATEMTPDEMDAYREKQLQDSSEHKRAIDSSQEAARRQFADKEIEVYKYMKRKWTVIAESDSGYDPDIHDDLVADEAARKFGINKKEAMSIYIKIDLAGLKLEK